MTIMNIVFRVDASYEIGTGHVMRCLTLAQALKNSGTEILFICRELPGNLADYIKNQGFQILRLPYNPESAQEDWLIMDHYGLDIAWQATLRPCVNKIMAIDDLANRHHDCDLLLDQNLYENLEKRYRGFIPEKAVALLGPEYVLLRPEFLKERQNMKKRDGTIRRIFLFFGGSDSGNYTGMAMEGILSLKVKDLVVDLVAGPSNQNKKILKEIYGRIEGVNYYESVGNMAELMAGADLAIGAVGTTTWERCCLGLPSLVVTVADNQVEAARKADRSGFLLYLGEASGVNSAKLAAALRNLFSQPEKVSAMAQRAAEIVDGRGTERVMAGLLR
jgi:UDP-2,4-diacetamido-2,4,6-trideoxy-beta-L-altropyranose hydrolase